jgi:hypothetical protein
LKPATDCVCFGINTLFLARMVKVPGKSLLFLDRRPHKRRLRL